MKYYKDQADGVYGIPSASKHVPTEWIEITKAEFDVLTAPSAADITAADEAIRTNQEAQEIRADTKFQAFITKTPTQVKSWTKNSFPSLTLAEQNDLATLVQAICILGRRL